MELTLITYPYTTKQNQIQLDIHMTIIPFMSIVSNSCLQTSPTTFRRVRKKKRKKKGEVITQKQFPISHRIFYLYMYHMAWDTGKEKRVYIEVIPNN